MAAPILQGSSSVTALNERLAGNLHSTSQSLEGVIAEINAETTFAARIQHSSIAIQDAILGSLPPEIHQLPMHPREIAHVAFKTTEQASQVTMPRTKFKLRQPVLDFASIMPSVVNLDRKPSPHPVSAQHGLPSDSSSKPSPRLADDRTGVHHRARTVKSARLKEGEPITDPANTMYLPLPTSPSPSSFSFAQIPYKSLFIDPLVANQRLSASYATTPTQANFSRSYSQYPRGAEAFIPGESRNFPSRKLKDHSDFADDEMGEESENGKESHKLSQSEIIEDDESSEDDEVNGDDEGEGQEEEDSEQSEEYDEQGIKKSVKQVKAGGPITKKLVKEIKADVRDTKKPVKQVKEDGRGTKKLVKEVKASGPKGYIVDYLLPIPVGSIQMAGIWAPAIQNGEIQSAEVGATAMAASTPVPANSVPGSRLSVLFNPGPIQAALFGYLMPDDILNVAQADPYARRKIMPSLDRNDEFEKAKDYDWRGVNLANEDPSPNDWLCDVEDFPNPPGERRKIEWDPTLNPPPSRGRHKHMNNPPFYDRHRWYKCRRRDNHLDNSTSHCTVCNEDSVWKVYNNHISFDSFLPCCGLCHLQATRQYPWGYGPELVATPHVVVKFTGSSRALVNCECLEDIRYKTCYPCIDRLLDRQIIHSDRDKWPKYFDFVEDENMVDNSPMRFPDLSPHPRKYLLRSIRSPRGVNEIKWPICPCGREINPVKQPALYPDRAFFDGEFDIQELVGDYGVLRRASWSMVCIECDGLFVPRTEIGIPPSDAWKARVPFKEALGLGGKGKNHYTRKPWVNLPPEIINGEKEWVVRSIRDSRYYYRRVQYRVRWEGENNGEVDNVWYPKENFENAQEKVRAYHQRHPDRPGPRDRNMRRRR